MTTFVLTTFVLTTFVRTTFVITAFVLTTFVPTIFVLTTFALFLNKFALSIVITKLSIKAIGKCFVITHIFSTRLVLPS